MIACEESQRVCAAYRVTHNGKGIYEAFKSLLINSGKKYEWIKFIKNKKVNGWLKNPGDGVYVTDHAFGYERIESYFTADGIKMFKKLVLPVISEYIDSKEINIAKYSRSKLDKKGYMVYEDEYQSIYGILKNTR